MKRAKIETTEIGEVFSRQITAPLGELNSLELLDRINASSNPLHHRIGSSAGVRGVATVIAQGIAPALHKFAAILRGVDDRIIRDDWTLTALSKGEAEDEPMAFVMANGNRRGAFLLDITSHDGTICAEFTGLHMLPDQAMEFRCGIGRPFKSGLTAISIPDLRDDQIRNSYRLLSSNPPGLDLSSWASPCPEDPLALNYRGPGPQAGTIYNSVRNMLKAFGLEAEIASGFEALKGRRFLVSEDDGLDFEYGMALAAQYGVRSMRDALNGIYELEMDRMGRELHGNLAQALQAAEFLSANYYDRPSDALLLTEGVTQYAIWGETSDSGRASLHIRSGMGLPVTLNLFHTRQGEIVGLDCRVLDQTGQIVMAPYWEVEDGRLTVDLSATLHASPHDKDMFQPGAVSAAIVRATTLVHDFIQRTPEARKLRQEREAVAQADDVEPEGL